MKDIYSIFSDLENVGEFPMPLESFNGPVIHKFLEKNYLEGKLECKLEDGVIHIKVVEKLVKNED